MSDLRERLKAAGFEIVDSGPVRGSVGVRKYGCVRYLEPQADQLWLPLGPPCLHIRGLDCELEDKGYQKFWRRGETRIPIRKNDLHTLHRFDEELRAVLRLPALYHESLGTTCAQTDYDRLEGRPDR